MALLATRQQIRDFWGPTDQFERLTKCLLPRVSIPRVCVHTQVDDDCHGAQRLFHAALRCWVVPAATKIGAVRTVKFKLLQLDVFVFAFYFPEEENCISKANLSKSRTEGSYQCQDGRERADPLPVLVRLHVLEAISPCYLPHRFLELPVLHLHAVRLELEICFDLVSKASGGIGFLAESIVYGVADRR